MPNEDDGDRPITAAEAADLRASFTELAESLQQLRDASSERERREAREEVEDAREDLDELAGRLGISRRTLDASIAEARRAERREELRPIIAELLEEARAAEPEPEPETSIAPDPDASAAGADPAEEEAEPDVPEPDREPIREHWADRPVSEVLRR